MTERDTRNQQSDWNDRDRRDRDYRDAPRQPQQWHDESNGGGQLGYDDRTRDRDHGSGQLGGSHAAYSGEHQRNWGEEDARRRRADQNQRGYRDELRSYGSGYYDDRADRFSSFTSEDQGGRDFVSSRQGPYTGRASAYGYAYGNRDLGADYRTRWRDRNEQSRRFDSDYHPRGYVTAGRDYLSDNDYGDWREYGESRGFFARAGDEIASWFGDDDATRRREQDHRQSGHGYRGDDHRGRGPADYTRSDERIREDANEALTRDWGVDANAVTVRVDKGEVTLDGHVESRQAKRRAEDAVEHISGVRHVQNNLRVNEHRGQTGTNWNAGAGGGTGSGATSGTVSSAQAAQGNATKNS